VVADNVLTWQLTCEDTDLGPVRASLVVGSVHPAGTSPQRLIRRSSR
jgi:hypothetical protein